MEGSILYHLECNFSLLNILKSHHVFLVTTVLEGMAFV